MKREEWLESQNAKEEHIRADANGEYIRGKMDIGLNLTSFPKIYLPKDLI